MDAKDEIKARLSITQVVADYVQLKPAGKNMKGLCPFHKDTRPSLVVSEERGLAWCFACNNGGDIFSFVQQMENISFPEAMRLLAEKAGVKLPSYSPEKKEQKDKIIDLLDAATKQYEKNFWQNKLAVEEVQKRNISEKILKKYQVGFAWKGDKEMEKHLLEKGYAHKDLQDAGLLDTDGKKDKFRNRIMFPFFSSVGTVVGYSGRAFGDFQPKFLNSPETILFKKSEILFGLNFAREAIRQKDFCLVVEGQFDCLACAEHGLENVVAASGTAFSASHARQIMRFSKNITFALDADTAGIAATKRAIEIAIAEGASVSVLVLPEGKDPDDCLRTPEGEKDFMERLEKKERAMDFLMNVSLEGRDIGNVEDKRNILDELLPLIQKFPASMEREYFLGELAEKLGISREIMKEEFGKQKNTHTHSEKKAAQVNLSPHCTQREYFLATLISTPDFFPFAEAKIIEIIFPDCNEKKLFQKLKSNYNESGFSDPQKLIKDLAEDEAKKWELLSLYVEEKTEHISENLREKEFKKLISQVNLANFSETQKELVRAYKNTQDPEEQRDLYLKIHKFNALKKNL